MVGGILRSPKQASTFVLYLLGNLPFPMLGDGYSTIASILRTLEPSTSLKHTHDLVLQDVFLLEPTNRHRKQEDNGDQCQKHNTAIVGEAKKNNSRSLRVENENNTNDK